MTLSRSALAWNAARHAARANALPTVTPMLPLNSWSACSGRRSTCTRSDAARRAGPALRQSSGDERAGGRATGGQHPRPVGAGHGVDRLAELTDLGKQELDGEAEGGQRDQCARPHACDLSERLVLNVETVGDPVAQLGDHALT